MVLAELSVCIPTRVEILTSSRMLHTRKQPQFHMLYVKLIIENVSDTKSFPIPKSVVYTMLGERWGYQSLVEWVAWILKYAIIALTSRPPLIICIRHRIFSVNYLEEVEEEVSAAAEDFSVEVEAEHKDHERRKI